MPIKDNNKEPISYSKTKSRFVIKLAKEIGVDLKTLAIFWNRAKAIVALNNNCKLYVPDDYGTIVDIFKREVTKYFPHATLKFPKLFPKEFLLHRHEPTESLDQVLKRYRKEIKEAKKKCGGSYKIIHKRSRK